MTGRGAGQPDVAGGPARHVPVLVRQAVDLLDVRAGGRYVDATFGAGGYARAILATPGAQVIGIDRDQRAIARGADLVEAFAGRLTLIEDRFSALENVLREAGVERVDGVVFDLGVSSMQLDEAARGFSFRLDGPLDMRMGGEGPTAAGIVNTMDEAELARLFYFLGEERRSRAVARAIVERRVERPFERTRDLADVVAGAVGGPPAKIHPATRSFQALRIFVNAELTELAEGLAAAERILKPGGRLVVVTFHSLEDRIAKRFFMERNGRGGGVSRHRPEPEPVPPSFTSLTNGARTPDEDEVAANPRARSARMRACQRTDAAPLPLNPAALGVPDIKTAFTG